MIENRKFVDRLRQRIEEDDDLTPAGLAKRAGLSNATIRQLLSGKNETPTLRTAQKICAALGTTVEVFMSEARTEEEREIVRLVHQLPTPLLRQLLGYGQALLEKSKGDGQETPKANRSTE